MKFGTQHWTQWLVTGYDIYLLNLLNKEVKRLMLVCHKVHVDQIPKQIESQSSSGPSSSTSSNQISEASASSSEVCKRT